MNRFFRVGLALLAGVSLIWLVQIVAVLVAAAPGLGSFLHWLKSHDLSGEIVSLGVFGLLPVFSASVLVGIFVFRLAETRTILFVCAAVPFVAYSLYMNIGMLVWAGNSLAMALTDPHAWFVASMVPLGFSVVLLLSPNRSAA